MSARAIARRYAEALVDVVLERDPLKVELGKVDLGGGHSALADQVDIELRAFAEMMKPGDELNTVFASPIVSQGDKAKVLNALIERARPADLTANLLRALLKNYRLHHLGEVREQYGRLINERRRVIVAKVITAAPLNDAARERLGRKLEQVTGRRIEFEFKTDPSVIGGAITRLGSVVYDGSVRTQLQEIKHKLKTGE